MNGEIYTPYGFRDRAFQEARKRRTLLETLFQTFLKRGYQEIITPMVEYLNVYGEERGSLALSDMYKFVDRDGELLVLRPDLTPAAARFATTYLTEESLPCRISLSGSVFRYSGPFSGKEREVMQSGVELIGLDSPEADAEVLMLGAEALSASGLREYKIAVGYTGLSEDILGLVPGESLKTFVDRKNFPALKQKLSQRHLLDTLSKLVELLTRTEGKELLRKASDLIAKLPEEGPPNKTAAIEAIRQAVERMSAVQDILDEAGFGDRIVYDLGMAADLQYYTGVIFQAFTPGSGEYILDGGRYNELYRQFGKDWTAIGFGIQVDTLMEVV